MDSADRSINYRSCSFYIAGERGYNAEELLNLTNIHEPIPIHLNGHEHYHSHLTIVVPREEGELFRVVLKI